MLHNEEKSGPWWDRYRAYLKSEEWRWVRSECIKRDRACVKCSAPYKPGHGFQVHHKNYRSIFEANHEELDSVCLVCRSCHFMIHNPGKTLMQKIDEDIRKYLGE